VRPGWTAPLLALSFAGASGCFALHAAWVLRRPPAPLAAAVALELGIALAWLPAVAVFALRARRRFGSPFSPSLVRAFFPTFFDGTPAWLRRAAIGAVAYAWLFLFARWAWQLNDPDSTWPAPGDPELTAVAFAFYVLSAAILAGVGRESRPGPHAL
jgi:hypothetical protein